jgi:hypothetical protein
MRITGLFNDHLSKLQREIPEVAKQAILDNRGKIVNLVKFGQLSKGLNSDGDIIGRYSAVTEIYADAAKISTPKTPGSPYNMYWTGETLENMYLEFVDVKKMTYEISTIKFKQNLLEEIYGEIFKLTKEHNDWINQNIIEPHIAKWLEENMFDF